MNGKKNFSESAILILPFLSAILLPEKVLAEKIIILKPNT